MFRKIFVGLLIGPLLVVAGATVLLSQPVGSVPREGPVVEADAKRLRDTVFALAHSRDVNDVAALDAAAKQISEQLTALGYTPLDQPYTREGQTYHNVRVVIGDQQAKRVVVGAHYDSCKPLPAADDNASGVAVVLELARLLREHPAPGAFELVFWTLEEPPVFRESEMGSHQHAAMLDQTGVKVSAALSIETVGYFTDEEGSQHFPLPGLSALYSTRGNYVALVSNLANISLVRRVKKAMRSADAIEVYSMTAPASVPGIDWSDHANYWPYGIPALMVTDTAPNRNPNYHRASDTPDTLNYARMAALTNALFEALWQLGLAEGEQ